MKKEGYIVKDLDLYLLSLNEENDRAIDVNAPSQVGTCMRSRYYARTGAPKDSGSISPRLRRIFDNGTKTHERLQKYLLDQGMLIMDEVPVHNYRYNIQGHTDGVLKLSPAERGILEIKSINSESFANLKDAKPEHKEQGLLYAYCLEERRKYLRETYKTEEEFNSSERTRWNEYAELYQHMKDGKKRTRQQKIVFQCKLHQKMDDILYHTNIPITKTVFLYENKNTQDLKEFTVSLNSIESKNIMKDILNDFDTINKYVADKIVPPRCSNNMSASPCKWCSYKTYCWKDE